MPEVGRLLNPTVLGCATDVSEKAKRPIARTLLGEIWEQGGGAVTLQQLSEFFVAVTEKVERPIPPSEATGTVADILRSGRWVVIDRRAGTVLTAMDLVASVGAPYWDALIAACMLEHGIRTILTETERDFGKIPGLPVINPFQGRPRG